jgi:hypothetical protein
MKSNSIDRTGGQGLARFFELRGREIAEAAGALWYSVPGRIFMSLPYQLLPDPDLAEVRAMLRRTRALGVRYPSVRRHGFQSGLYVCRDKNYDLDAVEPGLRAKVTQGLENCEVRRATVDEMLQQGHQLNLDTMTRQNRFDPEFGEVSAWRRLVHALDACREIVPWGAFVGHRLAAYAITCQENGWLHILHRMSRQQDWQLRPNQALDFTIMNQLAVDDALETVCYGWLCHGSARMAGQGLHNTSWAWATRLFLNTRYSNCIPRWRRCRSTLR